MASVPAMRDVYVREGGADPALLLDLVWVVVKREGYLKGGKYIGQYSNCLTSKMFLWMPWFTSEDASLLTSI